MPLSENDKNRIRERRHRDSARQIARDLGQPRADVQSYIDSISKDVSSRTFPSLPNIGCPWWIAAAALALQNLLFFWRHIFLGAGFPGDFMSTSQAVPFYWIASIQEGRFPFWVPFQSMGFPLPMVTLSGIFYPPQWIWVLSGASYLESHAVLFQVAHIWAGALGMFLFCRLNGMHPLHALAAAAAFQLSGGFFHNAQHYPIIRTYAMTPWLLAGLSRDLGRRARVVLLPLIVFMMFTGGYPGTVLAALFVAGCITVIQVAGSTETAQRKVKELAFFCLLVSIGGMMAAAQLAPAFFLKAELSRHDLFAGQQLHFFSSKDLLTFGMTALSDQLSPIASLRSLFITLPLFAVLAYVGKADIRRHKGYLIGAALAAAMAFVGPFFRIVSGVLPPLAYSRFPCADYRMLICIPIILIGLEGFKRCLGGASASRHWIAATALLVWGLCAWLVLRPSAEDGLRHAVSVVLMLSYLCALRWVRMSSLAATGLFITLIAASGALTHRLSEDTWYIKDFTKNVRGNFNAVTDTSGTRYEYERMVPRAAALKERLRNPPDSRPARRMPLAKDEFMKDAYLFAWRGYLTGDYMLNDYSMGMQLWRQRKAFSVPAISRFMMEPWRAVRVPLGSEIQESALPELLAGQTEPGIKMMSYDTDTIDYEVHLVSPARIVENEMYFPGWRGTVAWADGRRVTMPALATSGVLRTWDLPAGDYRLETRFEMPFFGASLMASLVGLLSWSCIVGFIFLRKTRSACEPA